MASGKSVVITSGGQDSTTALLKAREESEHVWAVYFDYGQRHRVEEDSARRIAEELGVPFEVIPVASLSAIGNSALLDLPSVSDTHPSLSHLPSSFVPGRNVVFFALGAAYAMKVGATRVWSGVCQTDYSGYPDCREYAVKSLEAAYRYAMDFPELEIVTPLMHLTKAETFQLARDLGYLDFIVEQTHTCYEGDRTTFHEWGYGCGECPACELRADGWNDWLELCK